MLKITKNKRTFHSKAVIPFVTDDCYSYRKATCTIDCDFIDVTNRLLQIRQT